MLELENLTLPVKLSNDTEHTFDIVEVEMFLQETISESGEKDTVVPAHKLIPLFQSWAGGTKGIELTSSEAWQIMKLCRKKFEESKKKLEGC